MAKRRHKDRYHSKAARKRKPPSRGKPIPADVPTYRFDIPPGVQEKMVRRGLELSHIEHIYNHGRIVVTEPTTGKVKYQATLKGKRYRLVILPLTDVSCRVISIHKLTKQT